MKTKPDDITLTQWMDGELKGEDLRSVEAYAREHPELLAERAAIQRISAEIRSHVPSSEEPPYPEFFNQKILQAIEDDQQSSRQAIEDTEGVSLRGFWHWLTAPVAIPMALVAMGVCFYLGTQVGTERVDGGVETVAVVQDSTVYTPDGDVSADMFNSEDGGATVIVLKGLNDIPDDLEMAGGPAMSSSGAMMIHNQDENRTF
ncbi:hypothetical protein HW115_18310 [Verrucomicrobiaceae bacterium N1E253]|uniref:Anti-sigma factor n=1 Tax=Oceaniferula marina TaxID=2748318 RepID=A0A851GIF5_9BACT|nr:hypothetical protein [Oceaniferula marina]NWK57578.1 hypothetical protein [Oceaniferula marina]